MKPLALLLCAIPALAGELKAPAKPNVSRKASDMSSSSAREPNFKISFLMKAEGLESAGRFLVEGGNQGSYNLSAEPSLIAQCFPRAIKNEPNIRAECQFELKGTSQGRSITFQYQGTFVARRGSPLLLVDEPTRRLEIMIDEVKLPQ